MRIMKPGFTLSELSEKVLDRLPIRMARRIEDLGITSQVDRILGVMIRSHEGYLERENTLRKARPQGRLNNYKKKIFKPDDQIKFKQRRTKDDSINHRGYQNDYFLRTGTTSELICHNCNRKGHTKKCCWFPIKENQKNEEKKKEEQKN